MEELRARREAGKKGGGTEKAGGCWGREARSRRRWREKPGQELQRSDGQELPFEGRLLLFH